MCKMMRFLAHYYGATLVVSFLLISFFENNSSSFTHRSLRQPLPRVDYYSPIMHLELTFVHSLIIWSSSIFQLGRSSQTDINKPLFVPVGLDSYSVCDREDEMNSSIIIRISVLLQWVILPSPLFDQLNQSICGGEYSRRVSHHRQENQSILP